MEPACRSADGDSGLQAGVSPVWPAGGATEIAVCRGRSGTSTSLAENAGLQVFPDQATLSISWHASILATCAARLDVSWHGPVPVLILVPSIMNAQNQRTPFLPVKTSTRQPLYSKLLIRFPKTPDSVCIVITCYLLIPVKFADCRTAAGWHSRHSLPCTEAAIAGHPGRCASSPRLASGRLQQLPAHSEIRGSS